MVERSMILNMADGVGIGTVRAAGANWRIAKRTHVRNTHGNEWNVLSAR